MPVVVVFFETDGRMRILIVHNNYDSSAPSGENAVVQLEHALLTDKGHSVQMFVRNNDLLRERGLVGAIHGAVATPWNPFEAHRLADCVANFRPDVVHVHNTFPLLSPAVFQAARLAKARVLTLHNYRLLCAAAIPMREGRPCTDCIDRRTVLPALRHGCYRQSRIATAPLAAGIALHRLVGTWQKNVESFIALSAFQRDLMAKGGLPIERIEVKPNFYPGQPQPLRWVDRMPRCVFAGRLSPEKGISKLIDAWVSWGNEAPELVVLGSGPLADELIAKAKGANVRFLGHQPAAQAKIEIARSRLMILPSECFEGFPMTLREAFAFGTPAAVSNLGALPTFVGNGRSGLLLDPFDTGRLLKDLKCAWSDQTRLQALGKAGHQEFQAHYTADANYELLMQIYDRAIVRRRKYIE